jgi:hypothetical protein
MCDLSRFDYPLILHGSLSYVSLIHSLVDLLSLIPSLFTFGGSRQCSDSIGFWYINVWLVLWNSKRPSRAQLPPRFQSQLNLCGLTEMLFKQ